MAAYDKRKFMINAIYDEDAKKFKESGLSPQSLFQKYRKLEQVSEGVTGNDLDRAESKAQPVASTSGTALHSDDKQEGDKSGVAHVVGRSFAETFAYLKNTDHYKEPAENKEKPLQIKRSNCMVVSSRQGPISWDMPALRPELCSLRTLGSMNDTPGSDTAHPNEKNVRGFGFEIVLRGNPILKYVRHIAWEYGEIIPDYEIGQTSCVLFLSLRYHNLNPDYIHERLQQLGSRYNLRVLLVLVDVNDSKHSLHELGKIAIRTECTLILAWSPEEAGRYLETYKSFENKPPDILQEKVESDYVSKMQDCLTTIKSINKSDVITLLAAFGSLDKLVVASKDEIALCPGIGPLKAERLIKAFKEPFKRQPNPATDFKMASGSSIVDSCLDTVSRDSD